MKRVNEGRVVVSLGGSVIFDKNSFDINFIESFIETFKKNIDKGAIVVGGGEIARFYTKEISKRFNNSIADILAINITKNNALLVKQFFQEALLVNSINDLDRESKYCISGGFFPGLTTDSCAILIAEFMGINKVINISNADGIYSKDPLKNKKAKKIKSMNLKELKIMADKIDKREAGTHFIFDSFAVKLAERAGIEEIHFVGKDIETIKKALNGKKHNGTIVYNKN